MMMMKMMMMMMVMMKIKIIYIHIMYEKVLLEEFFYHKFSSTELKIKTTYQGSDPLLTLGLKGLNLARHYGYRIATSRASTKQTASSAA